MKTIYKFLAIVLLAYPLRGLAQCDLPLPFEGNTGSNMTVMLTVPFVQSLNVINEGAYLVALTDDELVVGSKPLFGLSQTTIAVWGNDSQTSEKDGASANEVIYFQLVDGESLYVVTMPTAVSYTGNGLSIQAAPATLTEVICEAEPILGCTDEFAPNYNENSNTDDGSCVEYCSTGYLPFADEDQTVSSASLLLSQNFVLSLNAQSADAYIVATTPANLVVGSITIGQSSQQLSLWPNDALTSEVDGAQDGELINFHLVDGENVYSLAYEYVFASSGFVSVNDEEIPLLVCIVSALSGCTDNTACNFNPYANTEDESCIYALVNLDCEGNCLNDSDLDGICDEDEIPGCTSNWADNYNVNATDSDASCTLEACSSSWAQNYDTNATSDDGSCFLNGCSSLWADNYNSNVTIDDGSCVLFACTSNWADNYDTNATDDDGSCTLEACTLNWADNYDVNATNDDGSCFRLGCTNQVATNYDGLATIDDNSCLIEGCMNDLADNYNSEANVPTYCLFLGCTNDLACNYLEIANDDDGSCTFPADYYDCNGDCIIDTDGDGICNELEVLGCQAVSADNYNPLATDSGICIYLGCMDESATNYDASATVSDNTCYVEGCMNPSALNYDTSATLNNENLCVYSVSSLPCELPSEYSGLITGSNMNILFTSDFSSNLIISSTEAYIVAMTPTNSVVGSTNIQQSVVSSITVWGDDTQTTDVDGALSWEEISFYLVDGNNYYSLDLGENVNYTENQTLVVNSLSDVQTLCLNGALTQITVLGCTDPFASNYISPTGNESVDVNTEDGTCIYSDLNNCVFPDTYTGGITGSNMSLLFTQSFMNSLPNLHESAYIVALNTENEVFGSEFVAGAEMAALTIWGDDSGTLALDGASESEEINLYLVNGTNLYDLIPYQNLAYSNNSMFIFDEDASITSLCSNGLVVFMEGCTDSEASNFNSLATEDDASCVYEGCVYNAFYEFNANASIDDESCENVIIHGCTDVLFVEYNPIATEDDGSCIYSIARIQELEIIEVLYAECSEENEGLEGLVAPILFDLYQGWNIIGYNLNYPQNTAACFDAISESIVVAKNNRGHIYWPEIGFNGIGELTPGQGYQIYMSSEVDDFSFVDVSGLRVNLSPTLPQWIMDTAPIHPNDIRTLARVVNMLGQEVNEETAPVGTTLIYLYNDGTVEKKIK